MRKIFPTFFIFFLLALAPVKSVFADGFSFNYNGQTLKASDEDLSSWQEAQTLNQNPALNQATPGFDTYLKSFLGQNSAVQTTAKTSQFNLGQIYGYIENMSSQINEATQEPALEIKDNRAVNFTPPQTGLVVDAYTSSLNALQALETGKNSSDLAVEQTDPQKQLSETNTLGINELVAEGVSKFNGSPKNRRFNIAVGVEKMKGVLVAPGETFSFDDHLGPVDGEHGFLPELVIKGNDTIPEFGGGLCQVSTTTFRAAMSAGLPIKERRNHAYAVQYYSPQGTDATIYPGSVDLKFVNNTPGTILIWPYEKDSNTLVFDFYGTKDGRQVTLEKPVIYDRQPDNSMKATWTRLITNNGTTTTDTFKSVYASPALFHHDLSFVSATGAPISGLKVPKTN